MENLESGRELISQGREHPFPPLPIIAVVCASDIIVKLCAVQGYCPLDKLPLLIIDVQVLTWFREHGPNDTPLDIGALEDVLLLVADAYRHVLEADILYGDNVAAMSTNRHPNTPPMDFLE